MTFIKRLKTLWWLAGVLNNNGVGETDPLALTAAADHELKHQITLYTQQRKGQL